ncbi:phosphoglycerate kinase [Scenedesmus sp. NREL 46B-D3]|nr:phosphoglycerate kinase [Scenedesmus sp. NREL 46B-D3]
MASSCYDCVAPSRHALDDAVTLLLSSDLDNPDLLNQRVLYRVDLNVPINDGRVADDTRVRSILPTLQLLLQKGAKVVLCSHLGRPEPAVQTAEELKQFSLAPVAQLLVQQLGQEVFKGLATDCIGSAAEAAVRDLRPGQACLLENLRFHPGEATSDPAFVQQLAALGDVYVNDAFGVAHREQASVTGVLPHMAACYPGLLMQAELRYLHSTCNTPERPFGVVIGGAKVRDKIKVLEALIHKADVLLIGGRMAFTFLAAEGVAVGRTQIEEDWLEPCRAMRELAAARGVKLLLPQDAVVAHSLDDDCCYGLDIGPQTAAAYTEAILACKTVFWNGPMGRFEVPGFAAGTAAVARAMGRATEAGSTTIVGGGDSVSAVNKLQPQPAMSYLSTGGGASLELIRGRLLPGIQALAQALAAAATSLQQQR